MWKLTFGGMIPELKIPQTLARDAKNDVISRWLRKAERQNEVRQIVSQEKVCLPNITLHTSYEEFIAFAELSANPICLSRITLSSTCTDELI